MSRLAAPLVFLPFVLPLTALPIGRLAEQHLHPRRAARALTVLGALLALCSTLCLVLLMVVGTAHLPGNPLPDAWSDPEVHTVVPYPQLSGSLAIVGLLAVAGGCGAAVHRHRRVIARAHRALAEYTAGGAADRVTVGADEVTVVPDDQPYAYALPGAPDRVTVSSGMLDKLAEREQLAMVAHERAHLTHRHHRYLLTVALVSRAHPLLRPLRAAVSYHLERWADEEAAREVGDRRATARAVAKAALSTPRTPRWPEGPDGLDGPEGPKGDASGPDRRVLSGGWSPSGGLAFAAGGPVGPVPRRVAALLGPVPPEGGWPPAASPAGLAAFVATAGTTLSALCSLDTALALFLVVKAATPL